jgi:hypothetical protein
MRFAFLTVIAAELPRGKDIHGIVGKGITQGPAERSPELHADPLHRLCQVEPLHCNIYRDVIALGVFPGPGSEEKTQALYPR